MLTRPAHRQQQARFVSRFANQLGNRPIEPGRLERKILRGQRPEPQPGSRLRNGVGRLQHQLPIDHLGGHLRCAGEGQLVGRFARRELGTPQLAVFGQRQEESFGGIAQDMLELGERDVKLPFGHHRWRFSPHQRHPQGQPQPRDRAPPDPTSLLHSLLPAQIRSRTGTDPRKSDCFLW